MTEVVLWNTIRALNEKLGEFEDENKRLIEAHNRVVQDRQRDVGDFHRRIREQETYWKKMIKDNNDEYSRLMDLGETKSEAIAELRKENHKLRTRLKQYQVSTNPEQSYLKAKNNQLRQQKARWKRLHAKAVREHEQTKQDWSKHYNMALVNNRELKKEIEDLRKQLEQTATDALSVQSQRMVYVGPKIQNLPAPSRVEALARRLTHLESYVYNYHRNDGE